MFLTKRILRERLAELDKKAAVLEAENAQLRERLAHFEEDDRSRREAERRFAEDWDNMMGYSIETAMGGSKT